ncbi:ATP-binding cassette domain-containing protein [Chloroflexi bacterium TSY]|nr:ATP-binding cassette domain-containing protein [Chloroflexi bacterium TSY]
MSERETLLDVKDLKKYFPIEKGFLRRVVGHIKAVDGVDFYIKEGETLGLVGESGCGKSTLGKCVLRGIEPTSGEINIRLNGEMVDVNALNRQELRMIRRHMQMIFQDPFSSLDPRMTVLDIVGEPLVATNLMRGQELRDRVAYLMEIVGLEVTYLKRYPHAFSGGQRQRLGIARALASNPKLVVADEPVSALDVSVQAQILNLLQDLQAQFNLTYLFVSHDLSVVEHICDRVSVMYVGKMVELAETEELFANPKHPYTEALLSAIPTPDPEVSMERILLPGEVANPADPPTGCYFHPRCSYADEICRTTEPVWDEVEPGHFALCHFAKELQLRGAETQLQKKATLDQ